MEFKGLTKIKFSVFFVVEEITIGTDFRLFFSFICTFIHTCNMNIDEATCLKLSC